MEGTYLAKTPVIPSALQLGEDEPNLFLKLREKDKYLGKIVH